jgi:hypothetical protein
MRVVVLAIITIAVLAGCAGSAMPTPAPKPPVVTEDDAVQAVVAAEPRLAGITRRDDQLIGQSAWYEVVSASGVGAFIVTVRIGWGDCPAGCIDEHTWTYAVQPDGTVVLQQEAGPPVPPDAWPSPDGAAGGTGIELLALAGPVCPVETVPADPSCAPRPVAAPVVIRQDGRDVASVVLGADGRLLVPLPLGRYTVEGAPVDGLMGTPPIAEVEVVDGAWQIVELAYDTGIR